MRQLLRAVLVGGTVSCAGCGPICSLGDGPGGSYYVTIRSSLGMLPSDLAIDFRYGSSDQMFKAADLTTGGTSKSPDPFSCALVGPDGGVGVFPLSTATSVACSTYSYGGDVSVSITGTGVKPLTAALHNGSDCQGKDVHADYVLVP